MGEGGQVVYKVQNPTEGEEIIHFVRTYKKLTPYAMGSCELIQTYQFTQAFTAIKSLSFILISCTYGGFEFLYKL